MPAEPPDRPDGWLVLTASERGAAHVAVRTPNQDSVAVGRTSAGGLVTAVADGHGHSRHLRSARGSRYAVAVGCQVGHEFAGKVAAVVHASVQARQNAASQIADLAEDFLVPTIVARWREAVLADVAADPFTRSEQDKRRRDDDPTIAYGSTLLLCVALHDWLVLAQIGDGDIVAVRYDGTAALPVPADPQLDGLVTTSLCGPRAVDDFRLAVVDTTMMPLLAVLVATDGYGNAQVVEEWPGSFSKDLALLLRERDMEWLAGQLPGWVARCASADGSADDTTVALLVSPDGQAARPLTPSGAYGLFGHGQPDKSSDEITIPASMRTDTARTDTARTDSVTNDTEQIEARQLEQEQADLGEIRARWQPPAPSAGSGAP